MATGHQTRITGYRIKDGKPVKDTRRLSVSQQIAKRKKPKQTWRGKS